MSERYLPAFVVGLLLLLIACILTALIWASSHSCEKTASAMGRRWQFSFWTDCMIETKQGWVPLNSPGCALDAKN